VEHIGLSHEELDRVKQVIAELDSIPPGAAADRRVFPRIDFTHTMWLNLPDDPASPWVHILSRNLSTSGLAFVSRRSFALGSFVVLSHHLSEKHNQLALASVKFCRHVDSTLHETGLEFRAAVNDPKNARIIPPHWKALILRARWSHAADQPPTDL
jgi:hypothetical protein